MDNQLSVLGQYMQIQYKNGDMTQEQIKSCIPFMISQHDYDLIFNQQQNSNTETPQQ